MYMIRKVKNYRENEAKIDRRKGQAPCIVCGKGIVQSKAEYWVHCHEGSMFVAVTEEEAGWMSKEDPRADMGCWPLGSDCLGRQPDLAAYTWDRVEGRYVDPMPRSGVMDASVMRPGVA